MRATQTLKLSRSPENVQTEQWWLVISTNTNAKTKQHAQMCMLAHVTAAKTHPAQTSCVTVNHFNAIKQAEACWPLLHDGEPQTSPHCHS
jgi:hypothetical protein